MFCDIHNVIFTGILFRNVGGFTISSTRFDEFYLKKN